MQMWWLGLDPYYVSYAELKLRGTVAQGWPLLGDLSHLAPLAGRPDRRGEFDLGIEEAWLRADQEAWRRACRRDRDRDMPRDQAIGRAQKGLWHYLQIQPGDIVVALEGRHACGLCCANGGYWYDPHYHYAQCMGQGLVWHDWRDTGKPQPPAVPTRLLAAKRIGQALPAVVMAWLALGVG